VNNIVGFRSSSDSPRVQERVHEHWLSLIETGADMPLVTRFDPLDIPFALGSLTLVDVVEGPEFTIRLLATNIQSRLPGSAKGINLRDFPEPDRARLIVPAHEQCFHERRPTHFDSDVTEFGMTRTYRARLWPFMDDHGAVKRIVACRAALPGTTRLAG
jgi:hypothetical protein